jgi:hypothetical protein
VLIFSHILLRQFKFRIVTGAVVYEIISTLLENRGKNKNREEFAIEETSGFKLFKANL